MHTATTTYRQETCQGGRNSRRCGPSVAHRLFMKIRGKEGGDGHNASFSARSHHTHTHIAGTLRTKNGNLCLKSIMSCTCNLPRLTQPRYALCEYTGTRTKRRGYNSRIHSTPACTPASSCLSHTPIASGSVLFFTPLDAPGLLRERRKRAELTIHAVEHLGTSTKHLCLGDHGGTGEHGAELGAHRALASQRHDCEEHVQCSVENRVMAVGILPDFSHLHP
jgi:hypothetical protein